MDFFSSLKFGRKWVGRKCSHFNGNGSVVPSHRRANRPQPKITFGCHPNLKFFRTAEVVDHVYPDHGALLAHFQFFGHDDHVYLWRQPKPIPWEECSGNLLEGHFALPEQGTSEACSLAIAREFEARVQHNLTQQSKPGLVQAQTGRCKTMETKKIKSHNKPWKPSRQGDQQPEFHGQNLQHQRWFTQLRRLESLARLYKAWPWNVKQLVHATREWRAILRAPGFSGFQIWWEQLPNKLAQAPEHLPEHLPTESDLSVICLTVHAAVRWFEKSLQLELTAKARNNRVMHPNKVFKDFAKPAVSPVNVLVDTVQAKVVEVEPSDASITFDGPVSFWPGELVGSVGPFTPIITCEDKMWLEDVEGFAAGQTVRQEKNVGQLEEMFARFQAEWRARWDRHLNTPEEQ